VRYPEAKGCVEVLETLTTYCQIEITLDQQFHCFTVGPLMVLPKALESVVVKQEGEDFFLLDTEGGEVFQVNATAARIFEFCRDGATYEAAVEALVRTFSADGQETAILEDIQDTVKQLQELGLCEGSPSSSTVSTNTYKAV
jgi:Coenzyme PQQ synthesis protein D (PqqD)